MKLLLDTCVWGGVCSDVASAGHDVIWCGDWPTDPGDEEILAYAYREGRVLVTLDKDFGEMAIVRGKPHSGIIRIVDVSATRQSSVCLSILTRYADEIRAGAIITTTETRVRIRPQ